CEIPKEWNVVKLKEVFKLKNGVRPTFSENGKYLVYGANGIMGLTDDFLIDNDFTIIFGRVGASGEIHIAKGKVWISDNAIYTENYDREKIYPYFAYYLLKWKNLKQHATKTTHPIITQTFLNSFKVSLPPLYEQQKIAEILSRWDEIIEMKKEKKKRLERMKKKIMELLLTGKVRVK
ncbi:MAG TPA: hypothetical protein ENI52_00645, partial [Thermoplasmata archaeon]|nr:hypothetical protein [Thermoplasmata archaeon]